MFFNKQVQQIPIFFASDNNYAPYLAVTLKSLLANASPDYFYKIHVLTSHIDSDYKDKINKVLTPNSSIEYISLANQVAEIKDKFCLRDYYSLETYYRFFIADLFPEYDKVIYLDCDLIILGDISDLYYTNISNYLVAAAHEQTFSQFPPFDRYPEEVLGVKLKNAFNAGMLLINAKMFRAYNIQQRFFNLMERFKFRVTQDEDYLNVLCKDKVRYLNIGWNKMAFDFPGFDNVDLQIIHYNLAYKPWHYENIMYEEYFWQYAYQTDFYDFILNQLKTYSDEQKAKDEREFDRLKNIAIEDINDPYNYKKTMERENQRHYIRRGLSSIGHMPGIKSLCRFLTSQGYKILYEYTKRRERQNKTFSS